MRTRWGWPLRFGGPFRRGFDVLWLPLLIGRLLLRRAFCWRLALRRARWRLFLGRRRWLGRLRLAGANAEQPLEQARLFPFRHGALTANKEPPSCPETTASTSAPAPSCASSLTGVKSDERPCPALSMSTWMHRPLAASRCDFRAATPLARSSLARRATVRPLTCGMRAAGVPSRAEKGNTFRNVSPHSSTSDSELWNMTSVSVGKP